MNPGNLSFQPIFPLDLLAAKELPVITYQKKKYQKKKPLMFWPTLCNIQKLYLLRGSQAGLIFLPLSFAMSWPTSLEFSQFKTKTLLISLNLVCIISDYRYNSMILISHKDLSTNLEMVQTNSLDIERGSSMANREYICPVTHSSE